MVQNLWSNDGPISAGKPEIDYWSFAGIQENAWYQISCHVAGIQKNASHIHEEFTQNNISITKGVQQLQLLMQQTFILP